MRERHFYRINMIIRINIICCAERIDDQIGDWQLPIGNDYDS